MNSVNDRREPISVMQKSEMWKNQYQNDILVEDFKLLGVSLSDKQIAQFMQYYERVRAWNQVMNLTAITEYAD